MSTTSLDDKIQQVVSEYISPATTDTVGIVAISEEDFTITDGRVAVKRRPNTSYVTRVSSVTKKIVNDTVVINIYTVSSLNLDITTLIVTSELLDLVDVEVTDTYTHIHNNYEVTIRKATDKYVLTIKQLRSAVDVLELSLVCVDSLGHHSLPYVYNTSVSADFIPTILSPTGTVYGTRLPIVIDTLPEDVTEVEFTVTTNNLSSTTTVDRTNAHRFDISDLCTSEDATYTHIQHVQKSAGTVDNIMMMRTTGMDGVVVAGIATSGHMSISNRNITTQLSYHDKFTPGTIALDMITDYFDPGICYILTLYSNNDTDVYSIYRLDVVSSSIDLVLDLDSDVVPVKFNQDHISINSDELLGVCCTSGDVLFLDNRLEVVSMHRFIQERIDGIPDSSVVASMCMVGDDTLCVWYRYGYELYRSDTLDLQQSMRYDLGHAWLPLGNSISTVVSTTEGLYYSTDSGTYTSTDGVVWSACHVPVYTHRTPPVDSVVRLTSVVCIDGVHHYYGCVTDHTPYPIGIVHTTDLIMYTYIPLDVSTNHLPITTITGNDIWLPGYMIMLTGCKYNTTIQVRCKLHDVWTDMVTTTIDVYA